MSELVMFFIAFLQVVISIGICFLLGWWIMDCGLMLADKIKNRRVKK